MENSVKTDFVSEEISGTIEKNNGSKKTIKRSNNGHKKTDAIKKTPNIKPVFPTGNPDTSLYKYNNSKSEFFHSLSAGQYLTASNFIAIDIDTDKVRYTKGKSGSKNIQIKDWGVQVTPVGEKDRYKAIKLILDNIKTNIHKSGSKIHVCFFSPDISIRQIVLPKMRKASELENAIYYKLQSDLPGFDETSQWRYKILEEIEDDNLENLRIVILIVPTDIISKYLEILSEAGLTPDTLVPRPIASSQVFSNIVTKTAGDVLVDISYDVTHINFVTNGTLEYSRSIASGASNLEVAVHDKQSKLLGPDSDKIELEEGINKNGATHPGKIRKALQIRLKAIQSSQNPVLQLFKSELQNSLDYFNGLNNNNQVKRIFLTGYGIQKESLLSYLKNTMKNPVFVLSPKFESVDKNTMEFGQYFTTIGAVIPEKHSFNLIPKEFLSQQLFKKLGVLAISMIVIAVILMGYLTNSLNGEISKYELEMAQIEKRYDELNPIEVEYNNINKEIKSLSNEQNRLKGFVGKDSRALEVMRLISNETPEQIIISKLSFNIGTIPISNKKSKGKKAKKQKNQNLVLISGLVKGDYLMGDVILVNYIDHLKNIGFFKSLVISDKRKNSDKKIMTFELKAQF